MPNHRYSSGQIVGPFELDAYIKRRGDNPGGWFCWCKCGKQCFRTVQQLNNRKTDICDHIEKGAESRRRHYAKWKLIPPAEYNLPDEDIPGRTYGLLTVLGRCPPSVEPNSWVCRCRCGKACIVDNQALRSGHTISCGCTPRS